VRSRRIREKNNKKDDILVTATGLFLEKGYSGTSTNDICLAAKINRPTLYWYFKSKELLFFSCHMKSIQYLLMPYLKEAASIEDPEERLKFMIPQFTRIICQNPELKVLIHDTFTIKDEYLQKVRKIWKKHFLLLKDSISQLQSQGKVRTDFNPSWAALLLLGMMTWMTFWFDHSRKERIEELSHQALDFAMQGLWAENPPGPQRKGSPSKRRKAGAKRG